MAAPASLKLQVHFNPAVATIDPLKNMQEILYSLILKIDLVLPNVMFSLLSGPLKDFSKESTLDGRSIAEVNVGVKLDVQIEHSRETSGDSYIAKGERFLIDETTSIKLSKERFLFALKTDDEISAVLKKKSAEFLKSLTIPEEEDIAGRDRLVYRLFIEKQAAHAGQVLGFAQAGPFPSSVEIDRMLKAKFNESPAFVACVHSMAQTNASGVCSEFYSNRHLDDVEEVKSWRKRVTDLECLFRKAIDNLAIQISNSFDMGKLKGNSLVRVDLKEIRFGVRVDDGSFFQSTMLDFNL